MTMHLRSASAFFVFVLALIFGLAGTLSAAGPGVTSSEIKLGNTAPYSGPASAYGTIGRSIEAYFNKINAEKGGVCNRKIDFVTLDDGYSPPKTVEQVRRLVEQEQVLLLFQSLGTPPNSAIHKYMNAKKVPQLFVATGATKWGQPKKFPWTMGWQPNYQTEAQIFAKYVLDNVENPKVGILFQNDDYGKDYLTGFREALGSQADQVIVRAESYEVTDPTVDSQMTSLRNSGANVFFSVTTPKFAAQAIRGAAKLGWKPLHLLNSVSNSLGAVIKPAGFENADGVITTGYIKDPTDPEWTEDQSFKDWVQYMKTYYPNGRLDNSFNVYGYTVAMTMEHVLSQSCDDLSRENVMRQAANIRQLSLPMLLPGVTIDTSPTDFYPIEALQLHRLSAKDKRWIRFGKVISSESK